MKSFKIISFILLISLLLHFSYFINHIDHECSDDNCPICYVIKSFNNSLLGFNPKIIELIVVIFFCFISRYYVKKEIDNRYNTLIGLRVRINS